MSDPAACWPWPGNITNAGYGSTQGLLKKTSSTHRLAWELAYGPIPPGLCVLHKCDNRPCCNPAHLFIGTQADNARDRNTKGRTRPPRGEANGQAKLTEDIVRSLRARYVRRDGEVPGRYERGVVSLRALAKEFGVRYETARDAIKRVNWRHAV